MRCFEKSASYRKQARMTKGTFRDNDVFSLTFDLLLTEEYEKDHAEGIERGNKGACQSRQPERSAA